MGLSPTGSGHKYTLDISDVDEGNPTLLTGVKTPTDANTNAAATVEYVKNKVAGGGGSPDAVLYTAQTLTDAQKKQARENVDAAIADFVINGTVNSDMTVTLDKTFAQIQTAIREGKQPVAKLSGPGPSALLPLVISNETAVVFMSGVNADKSFINFYYLSITSAGTVRFAVQNVAAISDSGVMQQVHMAFNPVSDMQIATKKYVDDALDGKAGTAEATTGAAGLMSAADKAKLDGIESGANKTTVPTALKNPNALTIKIGSTTVTYDGSAAKTVEIADGTEVAY